MRKSPIILLPLIILGLGWAYALMQPLLPDTSEFPRIPTADGTIWGYIAKILGTSDLANYVGDGTVENTLALSGVTADTLLKNTTCGPTGVWTWLTDGTPTCGADAPILAYLGTGTSLAGTVTAYRADGSIVSLNIGSPIREWDIIDTDAWANITITFVDGSLLRIDGGSTVSLDVGTTYDGQSLAYAILENGWLWWRVLTETGGYYIGNDDLIAWVRGTSVSLTNIYSAEPQIGWDATTGRWNITKNGTPNGQLSVIHSRMWADSSEGDDDGAVDIYCNGEKKDSMNARDVLYLGGINCDNLTIYEKDITYLYQNNPNIAANTIADLNYMSWRLAAGWLTASQSLIFKSEFEATKPEWTEEKSAICNTSGTNPGSKTYWDSLVGTNMDVCQDSNTMAFSDYTWTPLKTNFWFNAPPEGRSTLIFSGWSYTDTPNGIQIWSAWQYIAYNGNLEYLKGKTVTIKLSSQVPMPTQKNYIIDLWTYKVYKDTSWLFKSQLCPPPTYACNTAITITSIPQDATILPIVIPALTPTRVIIGAWFFSMLTPQFQAPIWTTIQGIVISN